MATATLDAKYMAERVVVTHGATTREFTYGDYQDWKLETPCSAKSAATGCARLTRHSERIEAVQIKIGDNRVGNNREAECRAQHIMLAA